MPPPTIEKTKPVLSPGEAPDRRASRIRPFAAPENWRVRAGLGCAVLMFLCAVPALAQNDAPTLDELLDLAPPAAAPDDDAASRDDASPEGLDPELQRVLDNADPADLLQQALRQMDQVAVRLGRDRDAGLDTQRAQESILAKLDQVIAAARRQQSSSSSSSSSSSGSSSPASARSSSGGGGSVARQHPGAAAAPGQAAGEHANPDATESSPGEAAHASPTEAPPNRPLQELRSEWGGLPPRLRDELTEGLSEQFSPIYRDLTEAYYRRLAEQH